MRSCQARFKAALRPGLPRFCGGLVGFFGYDTVRYIEREAGAHRQAGQPRDAGHPAAAVGAAGGGRQSVGKLYLIVYADPREPGAVRQGAGASGGAGREAAPKPVPMPEEQPTAPGVVQHEFSEDAFVEAVERAKRYIFDGDIMQVVLSQRISHTYTASPLSLYRALRALNPSPYMFYFDMGAFHVVGASPEILVRLEGDTVTLRPIAGTRPRGATREEDRGLREASCCRTRRSAPST